MKDLYLYLIIMNIQKNVFNTHIENHVRKELWREAMQKSNGTIKDTYDIYDKLCSFP